MDKNNKKLKYYTEYRKLYHVMRQIFQYIGPVCALELTILCQAFVFTLFF